MNTTHDGRCTITYAEPFVDGSGLPATIRCGAFVWAFDLLGDVRVRLASGPAGASRRARETSLHAATAAYRRLVDAQGDAWRALNRAMYAAANDASEAPRVGDRVEFVGLCCEGAGDRAGTVAEVRDGRFGTSYRVDLDDGGEEWASTIAPRGTRGAGCRFL